MRFKTDELIEKLKEAEKIAINNGIPFFATIVKEDTGESTIYQNFLASAYYTKNKLSKDYIKKCLLVTNGFTVNEESKPKKQKDEVFEMLRKAGKRKNDK